MLQLQIDACRHDEAEQISDMLEELGALSVTMSDKEDNPIFEPELGTTPLWPEVVIQALFETAVDANQAMTFTTSQFPSLHYHLKELQECDWEMVSKADFKPLQFGKRLWICPSWLTSPDPQAVNLILDPGLAFGTGTHPTTSLCLTWLEQADIVDKEVVDFGCGSGILALAALKLGAHHVHAIDIDEQALLSTQNNAKVNHIDTAQLSVNFPEVLGVNADVILANILLSPLLELKKRFAALLKPGGIIVVSGILESQMSDIRNAYHPDFNYLDAHTENGWGLLVFIKK